MVRKLFFFTDLFGNQNVYTYIHSMLQEIVVFLSPDYSQHESIWVDGSLTKEEITQKVNEVFGEWYYYDIIER